MKRRRALRPSSAVVAGAAALVTVALVVTGVATAGPAGLAPAKTIPTLPPSAGVVTTAGPTTVPDDAVTVGDPTTSVAASPVSCLAPTTQQLTPTATDDERPATDESAPGSSEPPASEPGSDTSLALPARAPLSQLIALSAAVLDGTDDVASEVGPFVTMPSGIATPPIGASVVAFDVTYAPDADHPEDSHYDAELTFTSPATPADLVAFYRATLAANGLEPIGDDRSTSEEGEVRELAYDNPDSEYDAADVVVTVVDAPDRAGDVVHIAVSDHLEPAAIFGLTGWPAGLPALDSGQPIAGTVGAELSESRVLRVLLSTTYSFAGGDPDALRSQMLSLLPVCGFFLDAPPTETSGDATVVHLVHNLLRDLTATFAPGTDENATVTVTGSITV